MLFHATEYKESLSEEIVEILDQANSGNKLLGAEIQSLALGWNNLGSLTAEAWLAFGEALKGAKIQSLNFYSNTLGNLTAEAWSAFCEALKGAKIQSLDLEGSLLDALTQLDIKDIICINKLHTSFIFWPDGRKYDAAGIPPEPDEIIINQKESH